MKVDQVLILAAGKGTRMGDIGKEIPKVIWPIFNKSILELEVDYAKILAPNADIYINTYNYKDKIIKFCKESQIGEKATIVEEQSVLDIGGAVHNLAETLDYTGNLLILNSDQFLFFDKKIFSQAVTQIDELDSLLFTYEVNTNDGYNALHIEEDKFKKVIKNDQLDRDKPIQTYTGMSLINLGALTPSKGESKFFDTVANGSTANVGTSLVSNVEYWDFGTTARYNSSIRNIFNSQKTTFVDFLKKSNAINTEILNDYNANSELIKTGDLNLFKDRVEFGELVSYI